MGQSPRASRAKGAKLWAAGMPGTQEKGLPIDTPSVRGWGAPGSSPEICFFAEELFFQAATPAHQPPAIPQPPGTAEAPRGSPWLWGVAPPAPTCPPWDQSWWWRPRSDHAGAEQPLWWERILPAFARPRRGCKRMHYPQEISASDALWEGKTSVPRAPGDGVRREGSCCGFARLDTRGL